MRKKLTKKIFFLEFFKIIIIYYFHFLIESKQIKKKGSTQFKKFILKINQTY